MKLIFSYSLVAAQIFLILAIFLTADIKNLNFLFYVFSISGMAVGLSAITAMRNSRFKIIPDVDASAVLVTGGPYKFIRHPMYSAILLVCLGLLFTDLSILRFLMYMGLFAVLWIKLRYEEKLLSGRFRDYKNYMKSTKRLVPFVL